MLTVVGAAPALHATFFVEDEWCEKVGPPGDLEASMLELVPGSSKNSRLSCQIKLNDSLDGLVVRTPETQEGC